MDENFEYVETVDVEYNYEIVDSADLVTDKYVVPSHDDEEEVIEEDENIEEDSSYIEDNKTEIASSSTISIYGNTTEINDNYSLLLYGIHIDLLLIFMVLLIWFSHSTLTRVVHNLKRSSS